MAGHFIGRVFLFVCPFLLLPLLYLWFDPFKVLRKYDSYFISGGPNYVTLNKDYVSTENFINRSRSQQYRNFIFGNSRSMFYPVSTWSSLIGEPEEQCYHFDASGENLYGITRKLRYLDAQSVSIKHALIVLDYVLLEGTGNQKEYFKVKHPALSGESFWRYQLRFFKAFIHYNFFKEFILVYVFSVKPDRSFQTLQYAPFEYNPVTNEIQMNFMEAEIEANPSGYYHTRRNVFFKRPSSQAVANSVIGVTQREMLEEVHRILSKHATRYELVISPLYDQLKLHPNDLRYLQTLFGEEHVHDFSGKNALTEPLEHFYEESHYRPHVAREILQGIYRATHA